MKIKIISTVSLVVFLLVSCAPADKMTSTETTIPTTPTLTIDDIRAIIYASNPDSPQYDPDSATYAAFPEGIKQLSTMSNAVDAAGDLAQAINFPRQDSYLAAQALLTLGPDITLTTIVTLYNNLDSSQNPETLIYSTILLSSTGSEASCAVGNIGPLLWHTDSKVRTAAAFALEKITGQDLVASPYELEISPTFLANSITADEPEGSVVAIARQWWDDKGSNVNWHSSYGMCDP